ncbi:iron ABC transporter permease [Ureaplasma urealyticum]|uniref:Iron ABC transporter permease n=3 Tax=Ureaplasma urealyticum TaxID=2130 RepID=A0AAP9D7P7_UREUR|nr:iron ABC transporter permease [Ureaplasma urealyticum]EDX53734.1 hemin permease [Ureaplasma urealyticum serovar 9 str. ATCC 33175]EDT49376.1 hemin permease [Ureaplasma urealyticum serovar 13 str. ATCC 33698]EDU06241.1 hemin permease [Ureaplasma urealyticum serovar 5 str. ATCC 27817]EDU57086.1 hemin permease [Ureaplasma urealyticum serovar 7 str. ATCC 27819]EDU67060.1 hemin permease [Ureaplasma urealyticum serovar 11 str. ATCC 33695]
MKTKFNFFKNKQNVIGQKQLLELNKKSFVPYRFKPLLTTMILLITLLIIIILIFSVTLANDLNFSELAKIIWQEVVQMIITGAALGVSSYVLQRITRNRFADVSIMGIGTINLILLCALSIPIDFTSANELNILQKKEPWIFMSMSCCLMIVYFIVSRQKENFNYKKLILIGVILTFFLVAIAQSIRGWLNYHANDYVIGHIVGSVQKAPLNTLIIASSFVILGLLWLLFNSYKLNIISTNQQVAKQLGIKINFQIFVALVFVGIMVGASYSVSGDFVYVGLLAGNAAMRKRNNSFSYGILNSGLYGMLSTLITYWIGISLIGMDVHHIGAILPLLIGPYFIYKVLRS